MEAIISGRFRILMNGSCLLSTSQLAPATSSKVHVMMTPAYSFPRSSQFTIEPQSRPLGSRYNIVAWDQQGQTQRCKRWKERRRGNRSMINSTGKAYCPLRSIEFCQKESRVGQSRIDCGTESLQVKAGARSGFWFSRKIGEVDSRVSGHRGMESGMLQVVTNETWLLYVVYP